MAKKITPTKDVNQLAKHIVDIATGQKPKPKEVAKKSLKGKS